MKPAPVAAEQSRSLTPFHVALFVFCMLSFLHNHFYIILFLNKIS